MSDRAAAQDEHCVVLYLQANLLTWTAKDWDSLFSRVLVRHLTVKGRRCTVFVQDISAKDRVDAAVLAAQNLLETPSDAEWQPYEDAVFQPLIDLCNALEIDIETSDKPAQIDAARRILRGMFYLRETTEKSLDLLEESLSLLTTKIVWEYGCKVTKVECSFKAEYPRGFDGDLAQMFSRNLSPTLRRAVQEWITSCAHALVFVPSILLGPKHPSSDMRVAYLASFLNVDVLEIWSLGMGLFSSSGDLPNSRLLRILSYEEAREICGILEKPPCAPTFVELLRTHSIDCSFFSPRNSSNQGTTITHLDKVTAAVEAAGNESKYLVKSVLVKRDVTVWSLDTVTMWKTSGFLARVFACFDKADISIDLIATGDTNLTVSLEDVDNIERTVLSDVMRELCRYCSVRSIGPCAVVTLVGMNVSNKLREISLTGIFDDTIKLLSKSANDFNLTFVVEDRPERNTVEHYHNAIFSGLVLDRLPKETFGPTYESLYNPQKSQEEIGTVGEQETRERLDMQSKWWWKRKAQLLEMTPANDPVYVYDLTVVKAQLAILASLDRKIFYAMKANCHHEILKAVQQAGFGFECVSMYEVREVKKLFPNLDGQRLLFTPNFAPKKEYEEALALGAHVTVDNLYCIEEWTEIFKEHEVILRIDTGKGRGHHEHVKTCGSDSKFGIAIDDLDKVATICNENNITVAGLHCHAGSGILDDANMWAATGRILTEIASTRFPSVRVLNVGGGLGVPYHFGVDKLDVETVRSSLTAFANANPKIEVWMEPGRFIAAECGVILTRVTQIKKKSGSTFVGVNAGMNTLIRPSLYQAHHSLVNLSQIEETECDSVTLCGPICESADIWGRDRPFPKNTKEDDVVLIDCVGAYGRCMASEYNMRPVPSELTLE